MLLLSFLALGLAPGGPTPLPEVVLLKDRPSRAFEVVLPAERWFPVGELFPIAHAAGAGFAVAPEGEGLLVDADGDGALERTLEGVLDEGTGVRSAFVVLEGERAGGAPLRYGVRLRNEGKGWEWAPSGTVRGQLGDLRIQVIDQDGDGVFGEVGQDAIVLGSSDHATFLSSTLSIGGAVQTLTVAPDGSSLEVSPFTGPTGSLDLASEFDGDARILAAVVRSTDGQHSFDLAWAEGPLQVPVGRYRLHGAVIGLGDARVEVAEGAMQPLVVAAQAETALAWGGPTRAEFAFQRSGDQVAFDPEQVWWYGAAGEEYRGWAPRGKSPEFTIKERKLGTELLKALFPGSC
ncbi:MAG: hypothetical protein ISQ08_00615 [Planctomycetes bacterium]|nr:hypothetical protein [Planctomycetota bacterium]